MLDVSLNPKSSPISIRLSSAVVNLLTFVLFKMFYFNVRSNPLFTTKVVASGFSSTFITSLSITIRSPTAKFDVSFTVNLTSVAVILNVSAVLSPS